MKKGTLTEYLVTLTVDGEEDTLRRVALLNSALYRVLRVAMLKRVETSDYAAGKLAMRVLAEEASPELVPGEVTIRVEAVAEHAATSVDEPTRRRLAAVPPRTRTRGG